MTRLPVHVRFICIYSMTIKYNTAIKNSGKVLPKTMELIINDGKEV